MAKTEITLAQAKRIAGKVGARIKAETDGDGPDHYVVTIQGRAFTALNGVERPTVFFCLTPLEAAHTAVIQTGQHSTQLLELCKMTYVNEDVLFQHWAKEVEPKSNA